MAAPTHPRQKVRRTAPHRGRIGEQVEPAAPNELAYLAEHKGRSAVDIAVASSPMFKGFARSAASALGREITRGLFGDRRR